MLLISKVIPQKFPSELPSHLQFHLHQWNSILSYHYCNNYYIRYCAKCLTYITSLIFPFIFNICNSFPHFTEKKMNLRELNIFLKFTQVKVAEHPLESKSVCSGSSDFKHIVILPLQTYTEASLSVSISLMNFHGCGQSHFTKQKHIDSVSCQQMACDIGSLSSLCHCALIQPIFNYGQNHSYFSHLCNPECLLPGVSCVCIYYTK